jgi:hypothetical protein
MKIKLLIAAGGIFALSFGIWGFGGFHTGWTQTTIEVHGVDDITGIEYTQTKEGFVPGIEFPVAGAAGGLLFTALALLVPTKNRQDND